MGTIPDFKIHGFKICFGPQITLFLQLLLSNGKLSTKSLFWNQHPNEHSVQTADDNSKGTSQALDNFNIVHFRIGIIFWFNCYQQSNQVLGNLRKLNRANFL